MESDKKEQGCRVHHRVEDPSVEAIAVEKVEMEPIANVSKETV